jgi:hypothetical protein
VASRCAQVVACLLICLGLAGCAGKVIVTGDVSVLVSERPSGGMDALASGRLEVVGGCLGADGWVIVWPYGTKVVDEHPLTIEIPDTGTFTLDDQVQVSGGFVLEHTSGEQPVGSFEAGGVTVPRSCAEHDVFLAWTGVPAAPAPGARGCTARRGLAGPRPAGPAHATRARRTTPATGTRTGRASARSSGPRTRPPPAARSTSSPAGTEEAPSTRTRE